jgi:DNA polymerase III epsilon subunit-like protein
VTKIVFLDTETTGLDSDRHEVWEIGAIARTDEGDVEYWWQLRPDLATADAGGLRIGRYYERNLAGTYGVGFAMRREHPDNEVAEDKWGHDAPKVASQLARLLDGVTLVGAVPDFDARFLTRFLRTNGEAPTWHYHLVDVETLAAGALRQAPPWDFDQLLAAYELKYDEADRHTALGDARMVRDLYDAVLNGILIDNA